MLWLAAALLAPVAHAEDVEVLVDRDVTQITLTCGSDVYTKEVAGTPIRDGKHVVTFPIRPGRDCQVNLAMPVGHLEQLGTWTCDGGGCVSIGEGHGPIDVPPGSVLVLIVADITATQLELTCTGGYRERVSIDIESSRGQFDNVPDEECTLMFKGGAPMKYRPIGHGAWECHVVSNTPVCKKR